MDEKTKPQVDPKHYRFSKYCGGERWKNYWYQADMILESGARTVLEIGPGDGSVTNLLRKNGIEVTTVDIDPRLKPDVVASVEKLPFPDNAFDAVLCSEVLEHIPYKKFPAALKEIHRVSKKSALIGLPHAGAVFLFRFKFPLLPYMTLFFKLPFFWKTHTFNGEHYWELGKRGYSRNNVRIAIRSAGFEISKEAIYYDDPAHCLFMVRKKAHNT